MQPGTSLGNSIFAFVGFERIIFRNIFERVFRAILGNYKSRIFNCNGNLEEEIRNCLTGLSVRFNKALVQSQLFPNFNARCFNTSRSKEYLGSPVVPFTLFLWLLVPLRNNQPPKKGALIITWLLGYQGMWSTWGRGCSRRGSNPSMHIGLQTSPGRSAGSAYSATQQPDCWLKHSLQKSTTTISAVVASRSVLSPAKFWFVRPTPPPLPPLPPSTPTTHPNKTQLAYMKSMRATYYPTTTIQACAQSRTCSSPCKERLLGRTVACAKTRRLFFGMRGSGPLGAFRVCARFSLTMPIQAVKGSKSTNQ